VKQMINAGLKGSHRRCAGTGAASAPSGLWSGSPAGRGGGCSPRSVRGWCPEAQTLEYTRPAAAHTHKHTHSAEPASDASSIRTLTHTCCPHNDIFCHTLAVELLLAALTHSSGSLILWNGQS